MGDIIREFDEDKQGAQGQWDKDVLDQVDEYAEEEEEEDVFDQVEDYAEEENDNEEAHWSMLIPLKIVSSQGLQQLVLLVRDCSLNKLYHCI